VDVDDVDETFDLIKQDSIDLTNKQIVMKYHDDVSVHYHLNAKIYIDFQIGKCLAYNIDT